MNSYREFGKRLRWCCLATALVFLALGLGLTYIPGMPDAAKFWPFSYLILVGTGLSGRTMFAFILIVVGTLVLFQWMFLASGRRLEIQTAKQGKPMRMAVIAAGCMAMLLSVGLLATLSDLSIVNNWLRVLENHYENHVRWIVYGTVLGLWSFWAFVFWWYRRPMNGYSRLRGIATGLVAGSLLELIVAVGVYAWDPREEKCVCARGSYTGIVFSATVLIWAFGPALILLFLRQKQLREAAETSDQTSGQPPSPG